MQTFIPKALHAPVAKTQPTPGVRMLTLQTFSYESRKPILAALQDAMDRCGCWLLERKVMSHSQTDFVFEVNGKAIVDLYTSLIGAGLELTRASHISMTNLCSLMKHGACGSRFSKAQRIVNVRLEVSFLEDIDLQSILVPGAALA